MNRHQNEHHTIFGPSVGQGCHNCAHALDEGCTIYLICHDDDPQLDDLPYMKRIATKCPDWQTAFPQFLNHQCTQGCK